MLLFLNIRQYSLLILYALALLFGSQANVANATTFATVFHIQGEVSAKSKSGVVRKLKRGDSVSAGETVVAGTASEAVLKTVDEGIVAVRPNSELLVQKYSAEGKPSDQQVLKLVTGSLRIISGWIGKINPEQHQVITPGATIGIRGTDHEPYVLQTQAVGSLFTQGTYDKVNRGQTYLDANGASVNIDKGRVGFVRDSIAKGKRQRAMLSLLMPVLLDVVPDFYVGGVFEKELDLYSAQADEAANKALLELQKKQHLSKTDVLPLDMPKVDITTKPPTERQQSIKQVTTAKSNGCPYNNLGLAWLTALDAAIEKRDANAIINFFSADVTVQATVLSNGESKTYSFNRDEMVKSILASVNSLRDYQQRREANAVQLVEGVDQTACNKLKVQSIAIEQGTMNARPFRFEAHEEYILEKRSENWQAIAVTTKQK